MAINIEMPQLSESMTEGIILRWNKNVGEFVDVGDVIAEVETDKATIAIESYDDGYLIEQCACEGTKVPVGEVIARLDVSMPAQVKSPLVCASSGEEIPRRAISPLARKLALRKGLNFQQWLGKGSGPKGRIMARDIRQWETQEVPTASIEPAKPVASLPPVKTSPVVPPAKSKKAAMAKEEDAQVVPLSKRQKYVAEATSSAKSKTPHYYVTIEVDVTDLEKLRGQVNTSVSKTHGHHFTFNDFVIRAVVKACQAVPSVNSSFDESKQAIVRHKHIGINIATDANGSVLIPVLKDAGSRKMLVLSREVRDMAVRAKENRLVASDFEGGTITLTNLGARGVEHFYAIINEPQAAIISVGAITEKPVVRKGAIVVGQCVSISMSCDHRVLSGTDAAQFMEELKILMETPSLLLV